MSETADLIKALIAILAADADVAALAGSRIYGDELAPGESASQPRHAVVLRKSGGASIMGRSYVDHDTQRVDAFSYGATPFEAERLGRRVHGVFKSARRQVAGGVLVHWIEIAGGLVGERDRDADWPRFFQSYQAFYAEQAVA